MFPGPFCRIIIPWGDKMEAYGSLELKSPEYRPKTLRHVRNNHPAAKGEGVVKMVNSTVFYYGVVPCLIIVCIWLIVDERKKDD